MRIYEFLTSELISGLARHILSFTAMSTRTIPLIVLEVGAGNGRLSHFLSTALTEGRSVKDIRATGSPSFRHDDPESENIVIICTDSGDRGLDVECGMRFPVEKIRHEDALSKYKPDIVIVSWMELGCDWTESFRRCPSVKEYILIGEADSGVCGRLHETWGLSLKSTTFRTKRSRHMPHIQDGFERFALPLQQVGKTDDPWSRASRSSTVVFRRRSAQTDTAVAQCGPADLSYADDEK
jgi:hypothetical protein